MISQLPKPQKEKDININFTNPSCDVTLTWLARMYLCKQCQFNFDTWNKSSLISETSFIVCYHHVNSFVIQTTCLEREGQRKPPELHICISSIGGHPRPPPHLTFGKGEMRSLSGQTRCMPCGSTCIKLLSCVFLLYQILMGSILLFC
jgi:hypothetical protein